jgi:aryl-alcohol dehydrogenase-like predicted oxidoreductase
MPINFVLVSVCSREPERRHIYFSTYLDGSRPVGIRRFREPFRGSKFHALRPIVTLLQLIGDRYGKTPGQVALRWLLEQENVVPIPGAKNAAQATHNAGALSFTLTPDEVRYLNEATEAWRE